MKCTIPEISWHNRDPVLSVDVQPIPMNEHLERIATGGTDSHVLIWHVEIQETGAVKVEFAADLQRHQRAVNVVRFSPSGEYLASGDDESAIIIWKQKSDQDAPEMPIGDNETVTKEQWTGIRVLRGHVEDVYDLSWSPDSMNLISGSVDNSAIIWDVHKGRNLAILKEHKGFVQGVTWDPNNQFVATLCSDRTCRVYNVNTKKLVARTSKGTLPVPDSSDLHGKVLRLFHDDTLKSFFRRLSFSPDGQLLVAPSGIVENADKNTNATHIFVRRMLNKPVVYLPTNNQYTVAVRFCPVLFELREREPLFALPYRMVMAVATQNSVLLYDTQQPEPFGIVSNIHYTRLTDITWSSNGRMLIVSSTDGYCSIITFSEGELGKVYKPEPKVNTDASVASCEKPKNNQKVGKISEKLSTTAVIRKETEGKEHVNSIQCNQTKGDSIQLNVSDKLVRNTENNSASCEVTDCRSEKENCEAIENSGKAADSDIKSGNTKVDSSDEVMEVQTEKEKDEVIEKATDKTTANTKIDSSDEVMNCQPDEKDLESLSKAEKANESDETSEKTKIASDEVLEKEKDENSKTSEDKTKTSNVTNDVKAPISTVPTLSSFANSSPKTKPPRRIQPIMLSKTVKKVTDVKVTTESNELKASDKSKTDNVLCKEHKEMNTLGKESCSVVSEDGNNSEKPVLNDSKESNVAEGSAQSKSTIPTGSETMEVDNDKSCTPKASLSSSPAISPMPLPITPSQEKRTPRRVQFITLSSPKSKKKLL